MLAEDFSLRALCFFLILCLVGCSTTPKSDLPAQTAPEQLATTSPSSLSTWKAEGRIAASKGKKGGNASFVWQQNSNHYHIKLFGPFASGSTFIIGDNHQVVVRQANGKVSTAQTPEHLLQKIAGFYVPVTGLQHWMVGESSPFSKTQAQRFDKQGRLVFLKQDGWQIHFEEYHSDKDNLPKRLRLKNNELSVKLVIKSWKKN